MALDVWGRAAVFACLPACLTACLAENIDKNKIVPGILRDVILALQHGNSTSNGIERHGKYALSCVSEASQNRLLAKHQKTATTTTKKDEKVIVCLC